MSPNDDDDRLLALYTNGTWDCVECLSNSFYRVRVLAALNDTPATLRELMDELDIPRTSLQRSLSLLEQHGWIKRLPSRYTTTTRGSLITDIFIGMLDRVQRTETLAPFLDDVDLPMAIDIDRIDGCHVTVPTPHRPHVHISRLFNIFETAGQIRAFLPVVSGMLAKHYYRSSKTTGEHEFILSENAFDAYRRSETNEWKDMIAMAPSTRINLCVYDGDFPYGLFVCDDKLALAAYDGLGRMTALLESDSAVTIKWGEDVYEKYRQQSSPLREFREKKVTN